MWKQDEEWNVKPIRSKEPARAPVVLNRLVVPALATILIGTFIAALLVHRGEGTIGAAVLAIAITVPYAICIFVSASYDD